MRGLLTTLLLVAFFATPLSAKELTGTLQEIQKTGKIKNRLSSVSASHVLT